MKKVTQMFDGREALPVRAVPLVTDWFVTPQGLALELSKSACVRGLTAYRYWDGQAIPVRAGAWGPLHEKLIDIVRDFKRDEQGPDQHRQSARRESLKGLPADVFVWLDEFENWYSSSYISPDSVWEEQHRAVGEDDDLEPQFLPKYHDALDLFPISLGDFEPLISEGFETEASPVLAAAVLPGAEMADGASDGVEPDETGPLPLTTGDIAFCFAGLRWDEQKWKKPLGDKPKWLAVCIAIPGVRGVSETRWNPVLIGAALVRGGHAKQNSIRARFQTKPRLAEWLDAWKTYEADEVPAK